MNHKEILKLQAIEIHDLLSIYIGLHDSILNKSGKFSSLIKKVDFDDIYLQTETLVSMFDNKNEELHSLKASFKESIPSAYRQYFHQLLTFFEKLYETVRLLRDKQYRLLLKSKGEKYSYKEFSEMENRYKESVKIYMDEGQKLNSINSLIFN